MSGWNKPTEKPVETKKAAKPAFRHVLIASGVVAVLGCVLLLVFSGGDGAPKAKAEKKAAAIKEVKQATAPKAAVVPSGSVQRKSIRANESEVTRGGSIEDGRVEVVDSEADTNKVARKKSPFRSNMEVLLSMTIPPHPGERMPPVPLSDNADETDEDVAAENADIAKGMKNIIKGEEDDSEEQLWHKANVSEAKLEFAEYHKQGYRLNEYISALQEKVKDDADTLAEAQKIVDANYADKELPDEEYKKAKEKIDTLLRNRGLPATKDDSEFDAEDADESRKQN